MHDRSPHALHRVIRITPRRTVRSADTPVTGCHHAVLDPTDRGPGDGDGAGGDTKHLGADTNQKPLATDGDTSDGSDSDLHQSSDEEPKS